MDDELKALLGQLVDRVESVAQTVTTIQETMATKADLAALDAKLSARIDAVDAKVEEVRHVTSANHFKLVGRIDQVASMLADHMAEHDNHPPHGRRRA